MKMYKLLGDDRTTFTKNNHNMNNTIVAYLLLRIAVGASMFGHGLVRLPKLHGFSQWMVGTFEKSMLPKVLVLPFSYILPIAEFSIGLFLILGLFTQQTLIAGIIVMIFLVFGSCTIEEWGAVPSQLMHAAFFAMLLLFINHNQLTIKSLLTGK